MLMPLDPVFPIIKRPCASRLHVEHKRLPLNITKITPQPKIKDLTPQVTLLSRLRIIHGEIINRCHTIRAKHPDRKITILDIGIGARDVNPADRGITTRNLAQKLRDERLDNSEVIGLDVDLSQLEDAALLESDQWLPPFSQPNLRYIQSDARVNLGVAQGSIDLVVCFNVFTHLSPKDQKLVTSNATQALRPGGVFQYNTGIINKDSADWKMHFIRKSLFI